METVEIPKGGKKFHHGQPSGSSTKQVALPQKHVPHGLSCSDHLPVADSDMPMQLDNLHAYQHPVTDPSGALHTSNPPPPTCPPLQHYTTVSPKPMEGVASHFDVSANTEQIPIIKGTSQPSSQEKTPNVVSNNS